MRRFSVVDEDATRVPTGDEEPPFPIDLHTDGCRSSVAFGFQENFRLLRAVLLHVAPEDGPVCGAAHVEVARVGSVGYSLREYLLSGQHVALGTRDLLRDLAPAVTVVGFAGALYRSAAGSGGQGESENHHAARERLDGS